jgi:aspartate racemase
MRKLGLIGGLGPGATIHYYRELAKAQAGEFLIVHADMDRVRGDVERGDRDGLAAYFARLIERLARGGAEVAAISAVTPHICICELEKVSALPLVNIIAETAARRFDRVAIGG